MMFVDRRNTQAMKYQLKAAPGNCTHEEPLFLWIADMDIRPSEAVTQAVSEFLNGDTFGYADVDISESVRAWYQRRDTEPSSEWVVPLHSVVSGASSAVRTFTSPGDKVMVFAPTYGPLYNAVVSSERRPVVIDWAKGNIDEKRLDPEAKVLLICHPNNPDGIVLGSAQLTMLSEFCEKHDILIIADEVHADLVFEGPQLPAWFDLYKKSITLNSASKAFNLSALPASAYAIIPDEKIRQRYQKVITRTHLYSGPVARVALNAAYRHGLDWFVSTVSSLAENRELLRSLFAQLLPEIPVTIGNATYFAWLNLNKYGDEKHVQQRLDEVGVVLSPGSEFQYPGYFRLNFAVSPDLLHKAVDRLSQAF
ncbi:MalY/PatB family protein [Alteromonas sp. H39]|uniref:MalY/PatB family protein n=1 Tax=Alteromonas sp. H39 TaxID=3389876 RepID=UPI0039E0362C